MYVSPTSPRNDDLFARKVLFLRTLFEEFTDSCRYCNIYFSAGNECGKVGKGLRGHLSAPRAHNLLRGDLRRDGMDGVRVCVCVELINLERADIALFIIDVCVQP